MRVHSIFDSIDGEITCRHQGRMTTFIRLQGCNLRCNWCDTKAAQKQRDDHSKLLGKEMSVDDILEKVGVKGWEGVTITGGEPLMQVYELCELVEELNEGGRIVSIETNGTFEIPPEIASKCCIVMDMKMPSSGHYHPDHIKNVFGAHIAKFVIDSTADYDVAKMTMHRIKYIITPPLPIFAFSPTSNIKTKALYKHMVADGLEAVLSVQIHKLFDLEGMGGGDDETKNRFNTTTG